MKIQFLGHSCFLLEDSNVKILIDPFLTGNSLATTTADNVVADYIFVTHGHGDHIGDTISIAKRTDATVYAVVEIADEILAPEDIKTGRGNIGGKQKTDFGSVKYFPASHGSGVNGALACGYVLEVGGKKIYHAGDTGLIAEMQFLKDEKIDIAMLPIGDFYTMGPEDAVKAAGLISPKCVIPMHYNTFPVIKQNPEDFKNAVEDAGICDVRILSPGESLII
ncbi:MAG: metal-dependent hydrolase [Tissierellia bacterium]|nr:metal-dependent hydrolase [Tissierellia bacterium]MDD4780297.1 metal-dependent hydrolase [Tissierellia bacterium]